MPAEYPVYDHLLIESPAEHILLVTLNRPEVMNAFNTRLAENIRDFFTAVASDTDVRALVLRGAGDRAFCAGADLKERQGMPDETWQAQHVIFEDAFKALRECPFPTIAAVDGFALAGGLEMALSCDIIIGGAGASFSLPEVMRGLIPGAGGTQLLPRLIGRGRAKEMIFSGRRIDAATAERWGLLTRMVEASSAVDEALKLAGEIAANGPVAVRLAKGAIQRGVDLPLNEGIKLESEQYNGVIPTWDRREGINAFNERRAPRFEGR